MRQVYLPFGGKQVGDRWEDRSDLSSHLVWVLAKFDTDAEEARGGVGGRVPGSVGQVGLAVVRRDA